ncbi:MAG: hypothetical protein EKK64_00775 [Neisseriaceae bacterium]|nr:MAG: hypothetical protein EKK64_00775 [Neisseriaceae bacterium]
MFNVEAYISDKSTPDFLLDINGNWLSVNSLNEYEIENFASEEEAENALKFANLEGIVRTSIVSSLKWHCQKV